ncbi:MAG TPA: hypothetical protein VIN10_05860 [Bacteroidales bacterium]
MKNLYPIFVLLILFSTSCKKENIPDDNTAYCSSSTFQVTLDEPDLSNSNITEDKECNVIVFCKVGQQNKLIKLNATGKLLWNKIIDSDKKPIDVLALSDNSIVVLLKGESTKEKTGAYPNRAWITSGIIVSDNCKTSHELVDSCTYFKYKGNLELRRYDSDGNQLWLKNIEYNQASENSLLENSSNSFLLIAADLYGMQPDNVYDSIGNLPKIDFPFDRNKLKVYNISYDNQVIWESEVDNLFNEWSLDIFFPRISIVKLNDNILIKTKKYLITLDKNGAEAKRDDLYPEHCDNTLYFMIGLGEDSYIISGTYAIYEEPLPVGVRYTKCIRSDGAIIWQQDEILYIEDGNKNCFITNGYPYLKYYDAKGNYKYEIDNVYFPIAKINCNNGITFTSTDVEDNYKLIITRTDSNGNF